MSITDAFLRGARASGLRGSLHELADKRAGSMLAYRLSASPPRPRLSREPGFWLTFHSDHQYLPYLNHIVAMGRETRGPEFHFVSAVGCWQQGKVLPEADGLSQFHSGGHHESYESL